METDPGKHLFLDDFMVESMDGAHRVLNRPEKLTVDEPLPLVAFDEPWEKPNPQLGRVIRDEKSGRLHIYYLARDDRVCVLVSDDGMSWARPDLGLVDAGGNRANNITTCEPGYLAVFWDPHEVDSGHRWKRIDNKPTGAGPDGQPRWRACHSADGFDWRCYPEGPQSAQQMRFNFGSPAATFGGAIDPDARYLFYSQRGSSRRTRVLGRRDSADGLNWSGLRTVIDQDLDDPPGTEFYSAAFDVANRTTGGLHLLCLHVYQTDLTEPYAIENPERYWGDEPGPPALAARADGLVETQLAVSRDTVSWKRFREPFVERGEPGAWDWGMVFADAPVLHDGALWFFYSATDLTHNRRSWRAEKDGEPRHSKGAARLRPDGYVSVEAESFAPGVLTTHRFRQESGGRAHVDVDATAGELRYELLEDTGDPIPGFGLAECDPIRGDSPTATLSWHGRPGWPAIGGDRRTRYPDLSQKEFYVKLRFHIAPGAKLYSFTLDPPEVTMWQVDIPGRID